MPSLVQHIATLYPDSSNRTIRNWIKWGRVRVDGKRPEGHTITEGQKVEILKQKSYVLYSDKWVIAVEKPAGMLSVPDATGARSMLDRLRDQYTSVFPVHRLDRDASGVLLFARSLPAKKRLGEMFRNHELDREYIAVVEGRVAQKSGTLTQPLLELESYDVVVSDEGRPSTTHFETLRVARLTSVLRVKLETGRKHQIRVHLSNMGHPILGDHRYGAQLNSNKRIALHARSLAFINPMSGKKLLIESSNHQFTENL